MRFLIFVRTSTLASLLANRIILAILCPKIESYISKNVVIWWRPFCGLKSSAAYFGKYVRKYKANYSFVALRCANNVCFPFLRNVNWLQGVKPGSTLKYRLFLVVKEVQNAHRDCTATPSFISTRQEEAKSCSVYALQTNTWSKRRSDEHGFPTEGLIQIDLCSARLITELNTSGWIFLDSSFLPHELNCSQNTPPTRSNASSHWWKSEMSERNWLYVRNFYDLKRCLFTRPECQETA